VIPREGVESVVYSSVDLTTAGANLVIPREGVERLIGTCKAKVDAEK